MAIEKYVGKFSKEDSGCTIVINKTINSIRNDSALAMYIYLSCRPNDWDLNIKQLKEHFTWGKDKTYKSLTELQRLCLLRKIEHREKGVFVKHEYILMLRPFSPLPENKEVVETPEERGSQPLPCSPEVVPTGSGKTRTLNKQRVIQNKEVKINKEKPPVSPEGDCVRFQDFWDIYPEDKARKYCMAIWKRRKLDSIADEIIAAVILLSKNDDKWLRGFHPNPSTFLNQDRWNDKPTESLALKRQRELAEQKSANDKRLAEQEALSQKNADYERNKFTQMNKDGIAFKKIENKIKSNPANHIPLRERLIGMKS